MSNKKRPRAITGLSILNPLDQEQRKLAFVCALEVAERKFWLAEFVAQAAGIC